MAETWVEANDHYNAAVTELDANKASLQAQLAIAAALVGITIELGRINRILEPISNYIQFRAETEVPMSYGPFED